MQPAGADVFHSLVDLGGNARDFLDRVGAKVELNVLGLEQRRVLLEQRILRLGEDAHEVLFAEGAQLHADRKAALKLRYQVRRFGGVKRARGDEKNMVGLDHAVFSVDRGPLDDGQQIPLHAFARHVRPVSGLPAGDLVDLVQKDDPRLLDAAHRFADYFVHVDQLGRLLLRQDLHRFGYLDGLLFGFFRQQIGEHLL